MEIINTLLKKLRMLQYFIAEHLYYNILLKYWLGPVNIVLDWLILISIS